MNLNIKSIHNTSNIQLPEMSGTKTKPKISTGIQRAKGSSSMTSAHSASHRSVQSKSIQSPSEFKQLLTDIKASFCGLLAYLSNMNLFNSDHLDKLKDSFDKIFTKLGECFQNGMGDTQMKNLKSALKDFGENFIGLFRQKRTGAMVAENCISIIEKEFNNIRNAKNGTEVGNALGSCFKGVASEAKKGLSNAWSRVTKALS